MNSLQSYAYFKKWRTIHPRDKIAFALVSMMLCLCSPLLVPPLLALLVSTLLILTRAEIPIKVYLKLFAVPLGFILIGSLSVALNISADHSFYLWEASIGSYHVGISGPGLHNAILLMVRSSGAVSCLLFIVFTTPIADISYQLEQCRVPYIIIELITLVYRFIFVFWEQAVGIHTAQAARLGHVDLKTGLRSLAFLISSLFINVINRSNTLYNGLVARNYSDSLRVFKEEQPTTPAIIIMGFVGVDVLLLGLIFYRGSGLI